jgi:hypothetical protein
VYGGYDAGRAATPTAAGRRRSKGTWPHEDAWSHVTPNQAAAGTMRCMLPVIPCMAIMNLRPGVTPRWPDRLHGFQRFPQRFSRREE